MNRYDLEDTVMGRKIALLALLVLGSCVYASPAWAPGGNIVTPPQDMVGTIREVDRKENRIVLEERNLEVFATNSCQLDGLVVGQKVQLRVQAQDARQIINSTAPVPK
jgi:hypothetical protein